MSILSRIKASTNNFLEALAKANQSEFGDKKLDCCHINKNEKVKND